MELEQVERAMQKLREEVSEGNRHGEGSISI
jgi:hypothetical protein